MSALETAFVQAPFLQRGILAEAESLDTADFCPAVEPAAPIGQIYSASDKAGDDHLAKNELVSGWLIRGFDVAVAAIALVLFFPLLLMLVLVIRLTSRGPAIFCQQRVGKGGVIFPCLKLRSMCLDAPAQLERFLSESTEARQEWARDQKLRNDPRITPVGRFLRKSSLDELPQLYNILVGHMSVVGPRPITENEIYRYGRHFPSYCAVRPGLTGLWQISGRNNTTYRHRVRLDAFYARRRSLRFNAWICLRTVPALIGQTGSY